MKYFSLLISIIFQTQLTNAQTWDWGRQTVCDGGAGVANLYANTTDISGNILIVGDYDQGALNLSGIVLPDSPEFFNNIFIAKYNSNGSINYSKHFTGNYGNSSAHSIVANNRKEIFVSGYFRGTFYLDTITLNSNINAPFVFKADSTGNIIWAKKLNYFYPCGTAILSLSPSNEIIVEGTVQEPTNQLNNTFIEKLDSNGTSIFQKIITGYHNEGTYNSLFVSPLGDYYVLGNFEYTATLNSTTLSSSGGNDIFIAKFSNTDTLTWFHRYGTQYSDGAHSIIGLGNNIYFTSQQDVDGYGRLTKLNENGTLISSSIIGHPSNQNLEGRDLLTKNNKIFITGTYANSSLIIGNTPFQYTSARNIFIAEVDTNHIYNYGIVSAGTSAAVAFSISCSNDAIYASGIFLGVSGEPKIVIFGDDTLRTANPEGFLAKVSFDFCSNFTLDTTVTELGSALQANATGVTYQWLDCDNNYTPVIGATQRLFNPATSSGIYAVVVSDGACSDTSNCHVVIPVSIIDASPFGFAHGDKIKIFPNPATNEISVSGFLPSYLKLCNTLGQTVFEASKTNRVSVGNLPQGLYFLHLFDEKGGVVKIEKVIKE